jgi:hypothetical protein
VDQSANQTIALASSTSSNHPKDPYTAYCLANVTMRRLSAQQIYALPAPYRWTAGSHQLDMAGLPMISLHISKNQKTMEEDIFHNVSAKACDFAGGGEDHENVVLLVYGMSGEEDEEWSCHNKLQQKYDKKMTFVNCPVRYPTPLRVHSEVSKAPVLATNRPIALKNACIRSIFVMGLPEANQVVCFNYLTELMSVVADAKSHSDGNQFRHTEWEFFNINLFLHSEHSNMIKYLGEWRDQWCSVDDHGQAPYPTIQQPPKQPPQQPKQPPYRSENTILSAGLDNFKIKIKRGTKRSHLERLGESRRENKKKQKQLNQEKREEWRRERPFVQRITSGSRDDCDLATSNQIFDLRNVLDAGHPKIDLGKMLDIGPSTSSPSNEHILANSYQTSVRPIVSFYSTLPPSGPLTSISGPPVPVPSTLESQTSEDNTLDNITLRQHFVQRLKKRGCAPNVGDDMMTTWRFVGHNEETLRNLCREKLPTNQNALKLLLMKELDGIPKLPDSHSVTELMDETAEYFLPVEEEAPPSEPDQQAEAAAAFWGGKGKKQPSFRHCLDSLKRLQEYIFKELPNKMEENCSGRQLWMMSTKVTKELAKSGVHEDSLLQVYSELGSESVGDLIKGKLALHDFGDDIGWKEVVALIVQEYIRGAIHQFSRIILNSDS